MHTHRPVSRPPRKWPKSKTLPDQSYTVRELYHRFAKGLPLEGSNREGVYLDEENEVDIEKVNSMSAMDKFDLSNEMAQENQERKAAILEKREQAKREQEQKEAAVAKKTEPENPPKAEKA